MSVPGGVGGAKPLEFKSVLSGCFQGFELPFRGFWLPFEVLNPSGIYKNLPPPQGKTHADTNEYILSSIKSVKPIKVKAIL